MCLPADCFSFNTLPYGLQLSIFQKFEYNGYSIFEECSQTSYVFCQKNNRIKFPLKGLLLSIEGPSMFLEIKHHHLVGLDLKDLSRCITPCLLLEGPIDEDIADCIISRICGVIRLQVFSEHSFPHEVFESLLSSKKCSVKELILEHSSLIKDIDVNFDVQELFLANAFELTTQEIFDLKAKKCVTINKSNITAEELTKQLEKWGDGEFLYNNKFIFKELTNFSVEQFRQSPCSYKGDTSNNLEVLIFMTNELGDLVDNLHEDLVKQWTIRATSSGKEISILIRSGLDGTVIELTEHLMI